MGLTSHSFELLSRHIKCNDSILELGNQTIYFGKDYGKPAKLMFEAMGHKHVSIDLNGLDGALNIDLGKPIKEKLGLFDLVMDVGCSEHVEDMYICCKNKHIFLKTGGLMIVELPKTGNWAGHGYWYFTEEFFQKFAYAQHYEILEIGEHPAMGNTTDGWLICCVLRKLEDNKFISRKVFDGLGLKKS